MLSTQLWNGLYSYQCYCSYMTTEKVTKSCNKHIVVVKCERSLTGTRHDNLTKILVLYNPTRKNLRGILRKMILSLHFRNRYSKHGIHTVDDMYENGYPAFYTADFTSGSVISNGTPSEIYPQEDALRTGSKRSAKRTQLFVQVFASWIFFPLNHKNHCFCLWPYNNCLFIMSNEIRTLTSKMAMLT